MMDETPIEALTTFKNVINNATLLWHYRPSHLNPKLMKTNQIHNLIEGIRTTPF